jgi:outer membrane protein TolC
MKTILFAILLSVCFNSVFAQKELTITLEQALSLAQIQSLQSFLVKNYYLADYWQYRSYKADYLPSITFDADLLTYNKSSSMYYNSTNQAYEFANTQYMTSDASLYLTQNITATGGALYLNSDITRMHNYGDQEYTQYSATPLILGYSQDLFGFNSLKWQKKIEPLKFEKAKKEYVEAIESMNITTVTYFFQLALAKLQLDIAQTNYNKTDTLLQIAQKRFNIGANTKEELLDLKLSKNNTAISLQEASLNLRKANDELLTFLMIPKGTAINIILPEIIPKLQINAGHALEAVLSNNPEILEQKLAVIQAQKGVATARAENRFTADLDLDIGISKDDGRYDYDNSQAVNGELANVYQPDFEDYQVVNVDITIPILDWGKGKGYYQMAKSQQQIAEIAAQQALQEFEQNTITQVLEFNIQKDKVAAAAFSDTLAAESYELTVTHFMQGKVDVLKLVSSQNAKDNAEVKYVSALSDYWSKYYALRKLTLHDFETNQPLEVAFDELIK